MIGWLIVVVAAAGIAAMYYLRRKIQYPSAESLIVEPEVDLLLLQHDSNTLELRDSSAGLLSEVDPEAIEVYGGHSVMAIDRARSLPVAHEGDALRITMEADNPARYIEIAYEGRQRIVGQRVLSIPGAINFRELGGYQSANGQRVRWGQVFRSGSLAAMDDEGWSALADLGVQFICDYRSIEEASLEPDRIPEDRRVRYLHLPLSTEDSSLRRLRTVLFNPRGVADLLPEMYRRVMIDNNPQIYGETLRRLADPENLPALFHCTAGKDRTGIAAALLLSVLGVPEPVIIADYTLSNLSFHHFYDYAGRALKPVAWMRVQADDLQPLLTADSATMAATLAHIRTRYGSVQAYLRDHAGVDDAVMARLCELLLE